MGCLMQVPCVRAIEKRHRTSGTFFSKKRKNIFQKKYALLWHHHFFYMWCRIGCHHHKTIWQSIFMDLFSIAFGCILYAFCQRNKRNHIIPSKKIRRYQNDGLFLIQFCFQKQRCYFLFVLTHFLKFCNKFSQCFGVFCICTKHICFWVKCNTVFQFLTTFF